METPPDKQTHTLELPDVDLVHDVRGPLPSADGRPPLLMIGQPMCAGGFEALAAELPDRTVVTYDPRGLGRSTTRRDGRTDQNPHDQAADLHALVEHLGVGPVDLFASSGGAVRRCTGQPPTPRTSARSSRTSRRRCGHCPTQKRSSAPPRRSVLPMRSAGSGPGWRPSSGWRAGRVSSPTSSSPEPPADPGQLGLPTADDGSRDDPLLSDSSKAVASSKPDLDALRTREAPAGPCRRRGDRGRDHRPHDSRCRGRARAARDHLPGRSRWFRERRRSVAGQVGRVRRAS